MSHLLDTNICSAHFRRPGGLAHRFIQTGISVPTADLMIAAVALAHDLTLVTNNTADFWNIPRLHLEEWLTP